MVVVIAIVICSFDLLVATGMISRFPTINESSPTWLFVGAYVTYSGTTTLGGNITVKDQIVTFNSLKVELLTYSLADGIQNQSTSWDPYSSAGINNTAGETLISKTNTARLIGGTNGKVYQVNAVAWRDSRNNTITDYFVGSESWPIEETAIGSGAYQFISYDIFLVGTNIPGLTLA